MLSLILVAYPQSLASVPAPILLKRRNTTTAPYGKACLRHDENARADGPCPIIVVWVLSPHRKLALPQNTVVQAGSYRKSYDTGMLE